MLRSVLRGGVFPFLSDRSSQARRCVVQGYRPALIRAAQHGRLAMVELLAGRGADLNQADMVSGLASFAMSRRRCFSDSPECVAGLLSQVADTALLHAIEHGHVSVAEFLVDAGADLDGDCFVRKTHH